MSDRTQTEPSAGPRTEDSVRARFFETAVPLRYRQKWIDTGKYCGQNVKTVKVCVFLEFLR